MPAQHWSAPMQSFGGHAMVASNARGGGGDAAAVGSYAAGNGGGGGTMTSSSPGAGAGASGSSSLLQVDSASSSGGVNSANADAAGLVYPALHLHPLNDSFVPKQISLAPPGANNRVKIGRQTNAKTVPHPSNGYFDSKVLSRMHAEVWSQEGKVFIKDVKSSNGTFINGERLSAEGVESDVFELHSEDMVEFGIDIVGEDNRTIIHHKVACRCYLVLTAEDALGIRSDFATLYRGGGHGGPMGGAAMGPGAEGGLRRGKSGMSFDHILSRLQTELQKSRETGAELGGLSGVMNEVGETLGGGLPPMQQPPYQHMVPPHPAEAAAANAAANATAAQTANVAALQEQLASTQASLATHVEKIRSLEGMLAEHETIKAEVGSMKAQMEAAKRDIDEMVAKRGGGAATLSNGHRTIDDEEGDFDDAASMASMDTVMGGAGAAIASGLVVKKEESPASSPEAVLRSLKADSATDESEHEGPLAPPDSPARSSASTSTLAAQNATLTTRLEALENQLEEALSLGRNLQAQHASATEAVRALEGRMASLEAEVAASASKAEGAAATALEGRWGAWRETLEAAWTKERQGWADEREEMRRVVKAWDEANGRLEAEAAKVTASATAAEVAAGAAAPGGARGRRGSSKSAKRRAARRHLNPALRALLYKPSHADAGVDEGSSDTEDEEEEGGAARAAHADARSTTDRSVDSSATGDSGATGTTPGTSPAASVMGFAKSGGGGSTSAAGGANHAAQRGVTIDPTVLGAAGVVAVGMAIWALSGKAGVSSKLS